MLGSAAQGVWETVLGPYQAVAMPAAKRTAEAVWACAQLKQYVDARPCDDSCQVAWAILAHSIVRALDYDFRLCPSVALSESCAALTTAW